MKPERRSHQLLSVTRSKAKMYEYSVPTEYHINLSQEPAQLFRLAIGMLGDVSVGINSGVEEETRGDSYREQLQFSAQFFDSYLESRLDTEVDYYLLILGSASYYLCGLPGSSIVLANRLAKDVPDLGGLDLEKLLLWLLKGDFSESLAENDTLYGELINSISRQLMEHFNSGTDVDSLRDKTNNLRTLAYGYGNPRQLLFADIISAMIVKRLDNSTRTALPIYSGLTVDQWSEVLQKRSFVKELWPAQHLIGKQGVLKGKSAIIQMPTSAGKTKATEMIIRSAFLSGRTNLAVVVAPFRALCREIKGSLTEAFVDESVYIDDPSDVFQVDFDIGEFLEIGLRKKLLVVTPEKLTYMLRQSPELAQNIGLIIYDEGHQFDNGTRGVTYELLLSSLKVLIPTGAQSILISAVISNADSIGEWLSGENGEVIKGANLLPTYRTVAFASWRDLLGRLEFVSQKNLDDREFFVPRIIEQQKLTRKIRERKDRVFPDKNDGKSIALYLGIKLIPNGSIAIFCGDKATVVSLCTQIADAYERSLQYLSPVEYSDKEETERIYQLHVGHFGLDYEVSKSAKLGVFAHSGAIPQGIRLSVEYAMQKNLVKFVVCTSTLAQGVNLPIRYLIVTSIYQAGEKIKTRDFHNLIGRAGRSGMYTEGSVLFADPVVYDGKHDSNNGWRWSQIKDLIDPNNSEPCASSLLSFFESWYSEDRKLHYPLELLPFINAYINGTEAMRDFSNRISQTTGFSPDIMLRQVELKSSVLSSLESYLMAHWDDLESGLGEEDIIALATGTLAYFLASEDYKQQLIELFKLLANNVVQSLPEPAKRRAFGRTLYGVNDSKEIEVWVQQHIETLIACNEEETLLAALWPILFQKIRNRNFQKLEPIENLHRIAEHWIKGNSYYEILEVLKQYDIHMIAGTQKRQIKLDYIVEICDNALAYDGTLIIGAVIEAVSLLNVNNDKDDLIRRLNQLQKRLKYGLPTPLGVVLYELGFSDRIVVTSLSSLFRTTNVSKPEVTESLRLNETRVRGLLSQYPSYFTKVFDEINVSKAT